MSNEKMREEFEAAYLEEINDGGDLVTIEDIRNSRVGNEYQVAIISGAWWAWQASRAAVVVQMPQQSGANLEWNQAIRYCIQAVEAAGLKVRP